MLAHCHRMLRFFKQVMGRLRCNQSKPRGVPVLPLRTRPSVSSHLILNGNMADFSTRHTFWISITLQIICFGVEAQLTKSTSQF